MIIVNNKIDMNNWKMFSQKIKTFRVFYLNNYFKQSSKLNLILMHTKRYSEKFKGSKILFFQGKCHTNLEWLKQTLIRNIFAA